MEEVKQGRALPSKRDPADRVGRCWTGGGSDGLRTLLPRLSGPSCGMRGWSQRATQTQPPIQAGASALGRLRAMPGTVTFSEEMAWPGPTNVPGGAGDSAAGGVSGRHRPPHQASPAQSCHREFPSCHTTSQNTSPATSPHTISAHPPLEAPPAPHLPLTPDLQPSPLISTTPSTSPTSPLGPPPTLPTRPHCMPNNTAHLHLFSPFHPRRAQASPPLPSASGWTCVPAASRLPACWSAQAGPDPFPPRSHLGFAPEVHELRPEFLKATDPVVTSWTMPKGQAIEQPPNKQAELSEK